MIGNIYVRLPQSDPLEQEVGKSLSSQCRALVVDRQADARVQDAGGF